LTLDQFFDGHPESRTIFDAVAGAVDTLGATEIRVTKSQVAFRRARGFAAVWMPGQYLAGPTAPLVLTVGLPRRHPSARWKEIVEPAPGRFTHHLELWSVADVDADVRDWMTEAWEAAG
jgi:hypothetical protein